MGRPPTLLIDAATWRRTGVQVRGALELPATAEGYLRRLAGELDTAYRNAAAAVDEHPDLVWLEHDHRRDRLHVARLDAIEEGESAVELRPDDMPAEHCGGPRTPPESNKFSSGSTSPSSKTCTR